MSEQLSVLEEKIKNLLEQVEALGEAGKVDEAEALMRKVDMLNSEKTALAQQPQNDKVLMLAQWISLTTLLLVLLVLTTLLLVLSCSYCIFVSLALKNDHIRLNHNFLTFKPMRMIGLPDFVLLAFQI
ncbi:uncharacterized protein LOC126605090 [Malus sylvestris]|uniref:uncharacterized protein LOC126605090 n=1 Tax=Malus sylvestris TaxID=3752 RepID=UPI0021ACC7C4|nr:uncharacterized protein LOC126605090 [Malus sylvestris]